MKVEHGPSLMDSGRALDAEIRTPLAYDGGGTRNISHGETKSNSCSGPA
jgi:hypothetical protein